MLEKIDDKIREAEFPCIMAKAVLNQGFLQRSQLAGSSTGALAKQIHEIVCSFAEHFRAEPERLHSCVISFDHESFGEFEKFESFFWQALRLLRSIDEKVCSYDPRVSSDPESPNFSFSVNEEAFFLILLHPRSPRKARRFPMPSIVFNPHKQFEDLRAKGTFEKVRSMIRQRDLRYQGAANPMLMDFGSEVSEIHQYSGVFSAETGKCPFHQGEKSA